jgi:glyoxylase-like metal-dependent hydrolase (beta-lactamase superfamily II)
MKIDDHLYLVGGGDYGFNLSNRLDCNSYVLDTGDGLWMIDAGFDGADRVVENMGRDGLDPHDVRTLFVTHYHADHAGALAEIRALIGPELTIAIADDAAEAIRTADEDVIGLRWAKSFGFYPSEFTWQPTSVEQELVDKHAEERGRFTITALRTDGHCKGHMCYLVRGRSEQYLFTGDHVFWGGKIILQNVADSSVQEYADSMNRLLDEQFESLLPGHLAFSMRNGKRHVDAAAQKFNKIGLPDNLL